MTLSLSPKNTDTEKQEHIFRECLTLTERHIEDALRKQLYTGLTRSEFESAEEWLRNHARVLLGGFVTFISEQKRSNMIGRIVGALLSEASTVWNAAAHSGSCTESANDEGPPEKMMKTMFAQDEMFRDFMESLKKLRKDSDWKKIHFVCYNGASGSGKTTWTKFLRKQTAHFNILRIPGLANKSSLTEAMDHLERESIKNNVNLQLFVSCFTKYVIYAENFTQSKSIAMHAEDYCLILPNQDWKRNYLQDLSIDIEKDILFLYEETSLHPIDVSKEQQFRARADSGSDMPKRTGEVFLFESGERSNGTSECFPLAGCSSVSDTKLSVLSRALLSAMDSTACLLHPHAMDMGRRAVCCASGQTFFQVWDGDEASGLTDCPVGVIGSSRRMLFKLLSYKQFDCQGECAKTRADSPSLRSKFFCCFLYHEVLDMLQAAEVMNEVLNWTQINQDTLLSTLLVTVQYLSYFSLRRMQEFLEELEEKFKAIIQAVCNRRDSGSPPSELCDQLLDSARKLCRNKIRNSGTPGLNAHLQIRLPKDDTERLQTMMKVMLAGLSGIAVDTTRPLVRTLLRTSHFCKLQPSSLSSEITSEPTSQFSVNVLLGTLQQLSKYCDKKADLANLLDRVCKVFSNSNDFSELFEEVAFAHMHLVLLLLAKAFPSGAHFDTSLLSGFSASWFEDGLDAPVISDHIRRYFSVPGFLQWNSFPRCYRKCTSCTENDNALKTLCLELCIENKVFSVTALEEKTPGKMPDVLKYLQDFLQKNVKQSPKKVAVLLCNGRSHCVGFDSFVAILTEKHLRLFLCEAKTRVPQQSNQAAKDAITSDVKSKVENCKTLLDDLENNDQFIHPGRDFEKYFVLQTYGSVNETVCSLPSASGMHFLWRRYRPGEIGYLPSLSLQPNLRSRVFPANCVISTRQPLQGRGDV